MAGRCVQAQCREGIQIYPPPSPFYKMESWFFSWHSCCHMIKISTSGGVIFLNPCAASGLPVPILPGDFTWGYIDYNPWIYIMFGDWFVPSKILWIPTLWRLPGKLLTYKMLHKRGVSDYSLILTPLSVCEVIDVSTLSRQRNAPPPRSWEVTVALGKKLSNEKNQFCEKK